MTQVRLYTELGGTKEQLLLMRLESMILALATNKMTDLYHAGIIAAKSKLLDSYLISLYNRLKE